jgi:hypothetical protein
MSERPQRSQPGPSGRGRGSQRVDRLSGPLRSIRSGNV